MTLTFDIERDDVTPTMNRLRQTLASRKQLNRAGAEGMLPLVERNFAGLAASNHNRFSAPSTFWNLMLSETYAGADDIAGFVAMPRPVALRYFGGTVTPKVAKNLAIPATAAAYGKSPKDFSDLRFVMFGAGGPKALVQANSQKIAYRKTKAGGTRVAQGPEVGGTVYFWLVPSATIRPNPNVLPPMDELRSAATTAVGNYIDLRSRRRS